jgi:hypothetical protein
MFTFLNQLMQFPKLSGREAMALIQGDQGFQPKLRFALRRVDMHMHAFFLAGEKEQPVVFVPKNGWTHKMTKQIITIMTAALMAPPYTDGRAHLHFP